MAFCLDEVRNWHWGLVESSEPHPVEKTAEGPLGLHSAYGSKISYQAPTMLTWEPTGQLI